MLHDLDRESDIVDIPGRDRGGGRDFRGGSGRFEPYNRDNRGMGRWGGGGDRGGYRDGGYRDRNQYNRYDDRGNRDRYGESAWVTIIYIPQW